MHGETTVNRFIRVVCPVNVRREDQRQSMGNRISFMPVAVPIGIPDPMKTLHAIAARTEIMKSARTCDLVALMASWVSVAPPPLQALLWKVIPEVPLPLPLLNTICTNVAGPSTPLYAAGRKMIAAYPHVPTGYDLGVNCAVQTYDGRMFFGLTADAQAAPDVGKLRDFLRESFAELCRAAGVKIPGRGRKEPVKPKKARVVRRRAVKPAPTAAAEPAPVPETVEAETPSAMAAATGA
jgi:diacylglycerol O-acyltransferase